MQPRLRQLKWKGGPGWPSLPTVLNIVIKYTERQVWSK